ncbi:hypothetical protein BO70DRAFT_364532 [Aspergillus heteromorphus CBS 117.55]|uniref:Uncharacterized protein n=1 Tax=Aspergillus heteromorphus CBS 117.55 TaxID=1448321 RepID=A0A317VK52_9EURO|nr:uncharacterized protein BO70DRAFT_364532 [Aspergillus heteromorphus CBS 117.55]PWY73631.1 hypothetical protein BO70DRAFT_364532 [Aspergillus heteromorphus CBS 117.55]
MPMTLSEAQTGFWRKSRRFDEWRGRKKSGDTAGNSLSGPLVVSLAWLGGWVQ